MDKVVNIRRNAEKNEERKRMLDNLANKGGGDDNGGVEARVAKLEAAVEHIQRDISDIRIDVRQMRGDLRTQFYWMIGAFAAVLIVMAKGFGWL